MSIYDSARLARAYAFQRPRVHPEVVRAIRARLGLAEPVPRALDVGCGAGLSTAALQPLARTVVGLEPVAAMLAHRHDVAPGASFVIGRAEHLPFGGSAFDLLAAAGSLNYADLDAFLPEASRVLKPGGSLVIYDFSAARRIAGDPRLDQWFATFEARYPFPPDYDLDVRQLPFARAGLSLRSIDQLDVALAMTLESYVPYAMSETNVEAALTRGATEDEIARWCRATLSPIFEDGARTILFDAYIAWIEKQ
jgi:SAM-dependent methyltransferase